MTDFDEALRHYCRQCRGKLKTPVANPREAFCVRGCYRSYHLKRCGVCEDPLEQRYRKLRRGDVTKFAKIENHEPTACRSPECKRRWREGDGLGQFWHSRYQGSQSERLRSEVPVNGLLNSAIKEPKNAKRWVQIAGPLLTPNQFHCATIPDGPDCQWKDGKHYERLEAQNRRDLEVGLKAKLEAAKAKEAAEIEAKGFFAEPEWREVISPDGVKCHVTRFRDPARLVLSE
jgi:hypothetical protein